MAEQTLSRVMLFLTAVFAAYAIALPEPATDKRAKTCPLTLTYGYEPGCYATGFIRAPQLIKMTNATNAMACAAQCFAEDRCKSFREVKKSSTCYLYSKYLSQMSFDPENPMEGHSFDRNCFSTNCKVIHACTSIPYDCTFLNVYGQRGYQSVSSHQYACSYGHTARTYDLKYKDYQLKGSPNACHAAKQCSGMSFKGSFDVHWHIPSKTWICRTFDDALEIFGSGGVQLPYTEQVNETRYTKANASVGAGYGYYIFYTD